jgi:hypothetical protein
MRQAALALFFCAFALNAQTPLGTVTGLALDPSGGVIPGVSISLTNQQTGVKRAASTNEAGAYSFPNLQPGAYKLAADAKGFRSLAVPEFSVAAYRTVRQDLRFEVSAASTEVEVAEAASPVVQVETPSVGSGLLARQIIELPTNLRSVSKNSGDSGLISSVLPLTVPGVVQVGNGAKWLTPGAGAASVKVKVDGIETTFGNFGSPDNVSQPSVEAVQEFTANVLTTRAEFGGMGTISTATKSGSNQFHGGVFWYMRNSALDARNFFSVAKPFQNMHNYGGSLGGALQKDKTFFFADFDGVRGVAAYSFSANVPSLAMRQGDFSALAALKNPYAASPYSGNTILPQYLSAQALKMQDLMLPKPNYGAPTLTAANYRAAFNGPEVHRLPEFKLDHSFSANHNAFARYQNKKDDYEIPGARSALPPSTAGTSTNIRRVNFWTLGDVVNIRPNLINEFRAGVVILVSESNSDVNGQALMSQLGIAGLPDRGSTYTQPYISISGVSTNNINLLNPVNDGHAQFADNLSWVRGRHSMKFGAEEISWFDNRFQPNTSGNPILGSYSFTGKFSGNAYADFLLGLPATVTRMEPYQPQYIRARDWSFYAQDDFRVNPRLTLMYGIRYEYNGPAYALNDNIFSFDVATGKAVVPSEGSKKYISNLFPMATYPIETADQMGVGRSLRNPDKNNFAPRFGFSYLLDKAGKTVVRGGWGMYYSHYSGNVPVTMSAGPFSATTVSTNSITNGVPAYTLANPFAIPGAPGTLALAGIAPRLLNSYTQQYTLTVERELAKDLGLRASYIGSKGSQLPYRRDLNQPLASTTAFSASRRPYPQYANITYSDNGANMLYSGLQTQVNRRFSGGLMFTSTWTWAKELSDVDDTGDFELNTSIENTYDRRRDRGNVYSVPRHQWMNQVFYELPFGKNAVSGGWQVNALLNLSTGNWFTPMISGADPANVSLSTVRPDVSASGIAMPKTLTAWYDRAAFTTPPNGRYGNAGRGIIQGPGYALLSMGLQKTLKLECAGAITLVASFNNILNHTNWGEPTGGGGSSGTTTVNNSNGGSITSTAIFPPAGGARTGQVGVRWSF